MGKQTHYEIILSLFHMFHKRFQLLLGVGTFCWLWWRAKLKMRRRIDDWSVPLMHSQTASVPTSVLCMFLASTILESCDTVTNDLSADAHSLSGTSGFESTVISVTSWLQFWCLPFLTLSNLRVKTRHLILFSGSWVINNCYVFLCWWTSFW